MDTTIPQQAPMAPIAHHDNSKLFKSIAIILGVIILSVLGYQIYKKYIATDKPMSEAEKIEVLNTLSSTYVDSAFTEDEKKVMLNNLVKEEKVDQAVKTQTEQTKLDLLKSL